MFQGRNGIETEQIAPFRLGPAAAFSVRGHDLAGADTEAVLEAVSVRLRPILMADVTTLIAMLPLALGLGAGGQYRAPLAIVLIGGLIAGGTIELFLIPPIYALVWDRKDRFKRRFLHA